VWQKINFIFEISEPWEFQGPHGDCDKKNIFEISEPREFQGSHVDCDKKNIFKISEPWDFEGSHRHLTSSLALWVEITNLESRDEGKTFVEKWGTTCPPPQGHNSDNGFQNVLIGNRLFAIIITLDPKIKAP